MTPERKNRGTPAVPNYAVGLLQRADGRYLIYRPTADGDPGVWLFPRGPVRPGESPEAAMRRVALEQVGLHVELDVGQPPYHVELDGQRVCFRCFLGGVVQGDTDGVADLEMLWVHAVQLVEFDVAPEYKEIAQWLANL